jgi:MFS family permease
MLDAVIPQQSQEQQRASSKRRIAVLYFFFYVYLSSMNSFFPAYYHHELCLSEELVGFLFGLSPIMTLLAAPVWALLADNFEGGRKFVLMITFTM